MSDISSAMAVHKKHHDGACHLLQSALLWPSFHRLVISNVPLPGEVKFDSLDSIVTLFSDRAVVFAGWDHYIAFDLFVSRYVLMDSQVRKISHFCVAPIIPIILLAGPSGFAIYACIVVPLFGKGGGIGESENKKKSK